IPGISKLKVAAFEPDIALANLLILFVADETPEDAEEDVLEDVLEELDSPEPLPVLAAAALKAFSSLPVVSFFLDPVIFADKALKDLLTLIFIKPNK
ncbi:MAG: hypothetical protein IKU15_05095, partial [Clostridia bacterium]|nr:hypothetical protein [Clostridia bacterium]